MIAPDARYLVEQGLRRMGILPDIGDREIGRHISMHQREKSDDDERESRERRGCRDIHQATITLGGAIERNDELPQRRRERQDEREMTGLGDHDPAPLPSFHIPFSLSRSATSFGI